MIGVKAAVICVAFLNRLEGDQVLSTQEQMADFEERPVKTVLHFIKSDFEHSAKA